MRIPTRAAVVIAACGATGCGANAGASAPAPAQLQVAGGYQIMKTTTENTCDGNLTPATVIGAVSQTAGAPAFTLNDSFTEFAGSVQTNGAFTIPPQATAPGHTGAPMTTVFESGRFTISGFDAQVRLDINGPLGQPPFAVCRVSQTWRGTKLGSPNVIPSS